MGSFMTWRLAMRSASIGVAVAVAIASSAAVANPIVDFFTSRPMPRPVAGDCALLARQLGPDAAWYGEYSGNQFNFPSESYKSYSARGCFESEYACRRWQNETITWTDGKTSYMFCRQGVPARYRR
jgi:hypothetical protein